MPDDTIELFGFPAVRRKKVVAGFDGGRITSDGGVMLLAAAERRMGIAQRLASLIADPRNPKSGSCLTRAKDLAPLCNCGLRFRRAQGALAGSADGHAGTDAVLH
jgi:hypothetical protein